MKETTKGTTRRFKKIHITEAAERLGESVKKAQTLNLGYLIDATDTNYAAQIIAGAVNAHVHVLPKDLNDENARQTFYWYSTDQYAPRSLVLGIDDRFALNTDENGNFVSPIVYHYADLVLPFIDFDFFGNDAGIIVVPGEYSETKLPIGKVSYFHPEFCFNTLLLAVPWGGAHSDTDGHTLDVIKEDNPEFAKKILYFEKCRSKNGKEGYDFYVLDISEQRAHGGPISDIVKAVDEGWRRSHEHQLDINEIFYQKWELIQEVSQEYKDFLNEKETNVDKVKGQFVNIQQSPTSRKPFVTPPTCDSMLTCLPDAMPAIDCTWSKDALENKRISLDIWRSMRTLPQRAKRLVELWLEFAPRYADLYNIVVDSCHGDMAIDACKTRIMLPNNNVTEVNGSNVIYEFSFSETHLHKCIQILKEFMDHERKEKEQNEKEYFNFLRQR